MRDRRDGSIFLVEVLVSMMLLAIISTTAIHLVRRDMQGSRSNWQRTLATIEIDNVADWVRSQSSGERWTSETLHDHLSRMPSGDTDAITMVVEPFENETAAGVHVVIRRNSDAGPIQRDLWQLGEIDR